jgi:RNase P protein component
LITLGFEERQGHKNFRQIEKQTISLLEISPAASQLITSLTLIIVAKQYVIDLTNIQLQKELEKA